MSPFRSMLAAAAVAIMFVPATLAAQDYGSDGSAEAAAFQGSAMSDQELSDVVGQGTPQGAFWRSSMREQSASYDQQLSAATRVTFDNWFNDVGSPMIWNNVLASR